MGQEIGTQRFKNPSTGFNLIIENSVDDIYVILDPAGTLASGTMTLPNDPYSRQRVSMVSSRAVTSFTLNPGVAGATLSVPITAIAANAFIEWVWEPFEKKWWRIG